MSRDAAGDGPSSLHSGDLDTGRFSFRPRTLAVWATLATLLALYAYDAFALDTNDPLVDGPLWPFEPWNLTQVDWMLAFSLVLFAHWFVLPLATDRARAARHWARLRTSPAATLSLAVVASLFVVGLVGPFVVSPTLDVAAGYQPPFFATVDAGILVECLGEVTDRQCHGTLRYPLGTTFEGRGVLAYTVVATRVQVVIGLVTAVVVVPLAAGVGTAAAYAGGLVDDLLMRLAEVVQVLPPLVVYVLLRYVLGGTGDMALLVGVFGLFSWGNVARLARSEALAKREELFVTAAEGAGGSPLYVVRNRILPNLSGTLLAATTRQIPALVLTEVGLSFLNLGAPGVRSWGTIIADGTLGTQWATMTDVWWISVVPVVALALTVAALNVLGDALDDVLDPRA